MGYKDELIRAMEWLARKENTIFIGQSVKYSGNAIFNTLKSVPNDKKIEVPVVEELQMGMSTGMALEGYVPITCYPRFDFLLLACNQLVNHLDKLSIMTDNKYKSKAIIRTSIGSERPLHPQFQHIGDYSSQIKKMCKNINVVKLSNPNQIFKEYKKAFIRKDGVSTILVEYGDYYNEK